jgi:hypothetical protein
MASRQKLSLLENDLRVFFLFTQASFSILSKVFSSSSSSQSQQTDDKSDNFD